ncbi:NADH dehydrogenase [ubiquinone] 1 beta subcomplex subunit 7 [Nymphon striatum]|nr:NADH dehydrogenase [ubiquinone] 1 beta subcomplex subunit 7 [Nymphon striatum]
MGIIYSRTIDANLTNPDLYPETDKDPTFDALYGFPSGRQERKMIATNEEMVKAKLPIDKRDYCAHLLIKYHACFYDKFPWVHQCSHEKHDYIHCEYDDYVSRMKEYERERRLLVRKKKREKESLEE